MSGPPSHGDYDPRRLFPFGLSPIPEVPSELASEVSSVYSYYEEDDEDIGSEEEEEQQQRSIMYSGSCSSVKSNRTLDPVDVDYAAASDDDDDETEEEDDGDDDTDEVEEDDDDEDTEVENMAADERDVKAPAAADGLRWRRQDGRPHRQP